MRKLRSLPFKNFGYLIGFVTKRFPKMQQRNQPGFYNKYGKFNSYLLIAFLFSPKKSMTFNCDTEIELYK